MTDEKLNEIIAKYTLWFVIAVIFFALLFIAMQMDWVGKVTSVTDVLSFGAIAAAAVTAVIGWKRADRVVQAAQDRAERHAQEERERIAKADAVILYRKLNSGAGISVGLLVNLTGSELGNLLVRFPFPLGETDEGLFKFYGWIQVIAKYAVARLPNTTQCLGELNSLYIYQTEFADLFMNVVLAIDGLTESLEAYTLQPPEEMVANFRNSSKLEENCFANLIKSAAGVCVYLEHSRKVLDGVPFSANIAMNDFLGYGECLYEAIGTESPFGGETIDAEDYLEMFNTTIGLGVIWEEATEFSLHRD